MTHWVAYKMSLAAPRRPRSREPVTRPAAPPAPIPETFACPHRGAVLRELTADLCGLRGRVFDVHQCAVHGECVQQTVCKKQPVKSCVMCKINGENMPK